ncbi:RNA-binding domain-containing protein [Neisseria yangbaofengii]|uniref:RNA-binding domain-containing protein n=1 Tax=Neisseria yangbaofengii TaxID=2709396 RepID=UPI0013EC59C8|nr:RNA-binding domain-containing protein [Neisseria yangbaofengii]
MNANIKLKQLLSATENEIIEFKEAKTQFDKRKLGKYFSALSNEANLQGLPNAWLVFGVNDHKQIVGTQCYSTQLDINEIKKEITDKTGVGFIEIHQVIHPNGRVLLLEIPAAPQGMPVAYDGHFYGRSGESLGALALSELERIRHQTQMDWSIGIVPEATFDDLDPQAILVARQKFSLKNPKLAQELQHWDDITFLNKAKITINNKITRTALLLLGKSESAYLLNPASSQITWILKDRNGIEKDYQHFECPLLLNVDKVFAKIRRITYRYIREDNLFPEEVEQYATYIIREALHNAIAHQDYTLGGKISLIEFEDDRLVFCNAGHFIPESVENVIQSDAPEIRYRNRFLADAMVNLNMIDTIGSGIRKMFLLQKERFFPLPEYDLSHNRVQVTIIGRVLDINYARQLAQMPDLTLEQIMLLDRVQKKKTLTNEQAKYLKQHRLIEGRKPNYYLSKMVAQSTGETGQYIRNRAFHDQFYKQKILNYLEQFGSAKREQINELLVPHLPDVLDAQQKYNKVKNLLQALKADGTIRVHQRLWYLSK